MTAAFLTRQEFDDHDNLGPVTWTEDYPTVADAKLYLAGLVFEAPGMNEAARLATLEAIVLAEHGWAITIGTSCYGFGVTRNDDEVRS